MYPEGPQDRQAPSDEDPQDSNVVISEFLCDKLGLDSETICIQRAHRIGKPQRRQTVIGRSVRLRHRPLIVAFRDFQGVELILSNVNCREPHSVLIVITHKKLLL